MSIPAQTTGSSIHVCTAVTTPDAALIWTSSPEAPLLTVVLANAAPIQRMPAIMDHDLLPDMGRMTIR